MMASLRIVVFLVNAVLIFAQNESEMEKFQIVPDVINRAPPSVLEVIYSRILRVNQGRRLTPLSLTRFQPRVKWEASDSDFYTLVMVNTDAPSRQDPKFREFQHWLVVNIPGNKTRQGEVLSEYVTLRPPQGTGLHRYVLLVFKQQGKEQFSEPRLTNISSEGRIHFNTRKFAQLHNLGDPVAGNFFLAEWEGGSLRD